MPDRVIMWMVVHGKGMHQSRQTMFVSIWADYIGFNPKHFTQLNGDTTRVVNFLAAQLRKSIDAQNFTFKSSSVDAGKFYIQTEQGGYCEVLVVTYWGEDAGKKIIGHPRRRGWGDWIVWGTRIRGALKEMRGHSKVGDKDSLRHRKSVAHFLLEHYFLPNKSFP